MHSLTKEGAKDFFFFCYGDRETLKWDGQCGQREAELGIQTHLG